MQSNLQKLLTKSGKITIAALDHRGSLKKALHTDNPELATKEEMQEWKREMVELYGEYVSGILIDPVYGRDLVNKSKDFGWMMSMEKTGYRGGKEERVTELQPDWSVKKLRELGAVGAKLLLYLDPENKELTDKQLELARQLGEECVREGIVFLLEPLSYKIEGSREEEVLEIARSVAKLPVKIFKFEYPGSEEGCRRMTEILPKPWVLLSAGMEYDKYKESLKIACESGASGMAVGRAVWQEFSEYEGEEREQFLSETSVSRIRELSEIVEKYGKVVE